MVARAGLRSGTPIALRIDQTLPSAVGRCECTFVSSPEGNDCDVRPRVERGAMEATVARSIETKLEQSHVRAAETHERAARQYRGLGDIEHARREAELASEQRAAAGAARERLRLPGPID